MKTKKLIQILILSFASIVSYAQVTTSSYTIFNNNNFCDIEIHWRVIDLNTTCSPACNGNNVVIAANSNIIINCVTANKCLIEVVLLSFAGVPIIVVPPAPATPYNPFVCDIFNNGTCSSPGPMTDSGLMPIPASFCGPSWNMVCNGNFTQIW